MENKSKSLSESWYYVEWDDGKNHYRMKKLADDDIAKRNEWFKYVFFPLRRGDPIKDKMDVTKLAQLKDCANTIAEVIAGEQKISHYIDSVLHVLAGAGIPKKGVKVVDASLIAEYIASFCQEYNVTIDDCIAQKYTEAEYFEAIRGKLGSQLDEFGVLRSRRLTWNGTTPPDTANVKPTQAKTPNQTLTGQPKPAPAPQQSVGTTTAKVPYRPTLQNSVGIQGGKVIFPTGTDLVFIKGDWNPPKNTNPRVYTRPRKSYANGSNEPSMYWNATGQGYEDCVLYWDASGLQEARALVGALDSNPRKPSNIGSYYLRKVKASGGYFKIKVACPFTSSRYITAYIQAARLQEMLGEEKDN